MTTIDTKFSIGDKVWHVKIFPTSRHVQCPDCLDEGKWTVTTPAGDSWQIECSTCASGRLREHDVDSTVNQMTIGSIHVNTNNDPPIMYMCEETGVDSGTVYKESDLFATIDQAMAFEDTMLKSAREKMASRLDRERKYNKDRLTVKKSGLR